MTQSRMIDDALFTPELDEGGVPALAGSSCSACGTTTFPRQPSCSKCGGHDMRDVSLPRHGTIWSSTVQSFRPKPPYRTDGDFVPFGLGYVDLGEVIVESRLTDDDIANITIGTHVSLVVVPAFTDDDGTQVLTYAFSPVAGTKEAR